MAANIAETQSVLAAPTSVTPEVVSANIDQWKAELHALGSSGQSIVADLDALKSALVGGGDVKSILAKLGHATSTAASGNPDLQALGAQLISLGS